MISKLSAHLGPASIFSGISAPPSLVLHLDAGNTFSYTQTVIGVTVSGGGTTHILNPRVDSVWNTYGGNYLQGEYFQDSATPSAGWYMVDDNGSVRQVLSDAVWFSGGNPTPIDNGGGWFMVLDGPWTIANTQSVITFYETLPTVDITYGGSTWYDLTNLNNDIELSNTTFNSTYNQVSQFRGSFEFNGTNSGGDLISGTAIPLMDSHYTIESWIQANDPLYGLGGIIGWGSYTSNSANVLRQFNNGFANYWVGNNLTVSATFSADYWYHLASTYDGANRTIYLNGESLGTDTPGVSHSVPYFNNLTVGVTNATEFFNGRISTIKVWNKNLNSTQLLSSFNSNKSKYGYDFGSMTFDGTQSAYLISSSSDYAFGTNDFTVEAFFNSSTSSNNLSGVISLRGSSASAYMDGVSINLTSVDTVNPLIEFSAGGELLTYTSSIDEWYHVAISRVGSTSSFFVNGNLFNEVADTLNYGNNDLVVGRYYTEYSDYYFNGIISNVRVINGTGLYTGTFSIPSVQLSGTVSNTKLLITSQEVNPTKDMIGLHGVTPSNIGWTSSLPVFIPPYDIYFDASNISSYSGTGTTLNSIGASGSVPGLIGTMTNVSFISGTAGGVLNFDGSSSISFDQYDFGDTITLNAWVYPRNRPSINTLMCNTSSGLSSNGFKLEWNSWTTTDLKMIIENGNGSSGSGRATDNAVITENSWQMLTYVVDFVNQTGKLYVNGVEQSSNGVIVANVSRNNSWYIGSMFGAYQMDAYLGEFKVWKSLQSDSEITSEFNSSKSRYGL